MSVIVVARTVRDKRPSGVHIMGVWGDQPFENDAALDWLADCGSMEEIRATLTAVSATDLADYLDVDDGSAAVAAAVLVAALLGDDAPLLDDARETVTELQDGVDPEDATLAVRALERGLGANSELASLWAEEGTSWSTTTRELVARLVQLGAPRAPEPRR